MFKTYERSAFIFRRDFRLYDNTGLINCLKSSTIVYPCFIFDERQIDRAKNEYFSDNCVQFMIESLRDLDQQLEAHQSRIFVFYGNICNILENIIFKFINPNAVYVNEDYTPFSTKRDSEIKNLCKNNNIDFYSTNDLLLHDKNKILKADGCFYKIFTPYYKEATKYQVDNPLDNDFDNYARAETISQEFSLENAEIFYTRNKQLHAHGGRENALKILSNIKKFENYQEIRDFSKYNTTNLSPYIKFGCVSPREVYWTISHELGKNHSLTRQLYWHDFYYLICYYYPQSIESSQRFKNLEWSYNYNHFEAWKNGVTGYPIVDAAMRQLNCTGYMSNRLRMIVATFLVKDLLLDWRWGEKYFATKLVDYDPAQNNGGWQWCASTGFDCQPYFRIFNPWLQSEKYDKDCDYIFKWCPELSGISKSFIHKWNIYCDSIDIEYSKPIVDHNEQKKRALEMYNATKLLQDC